VLMFAICRIWHSLVTSRNNPARSGSERRKECIETLDHGRVEKHRVTQRGAGHFRDHCCLRCTNHLARLGGQDGASEDTLRGFFDRGLQKTIQLAGGPCPRNC